MPSNERFCFLGVPYIHWAAVVFVIGLGLAPLTLALVRLWAVTGITPLEALTRVHEQPGAMDAFQFSLVEAAASTALTVAIGLPLAWSFGRCSAAGCETCCLEVRSAKL